jgi:hypothetical protein
MRRTADLPPRASTRPASGPRRLSIADVEALRTAALRFGDGAEAAKSDALAVAASRVPTDARALVAYHDTLLFLLAYPGSTATRVQAERAIGRVVHTAVALADRRARTQRHPLAGTGIAGCEVTAGFSRSLCAWLAARHSARAEVTDFGQASRVAAVLALVLPGIESEITGSADDPFALLDAIKGRRQTRLSALVAALERLPASEAVRDDLFESMEAFVTIRPERTALSRTLSRGPCATPFLHTTALQKSLADPATTIAEPLPAPVFPPAREQRALVELARSTLAMLARETDPVTWPSTAGVATYDLGRGATLALYPMHPSRRFALDSHTGYLLLKNGLPVAYGGGWPFLAICRTGINVFAPYRGGESSWLFARVLAAYRQHFGVKRFIVEPYQFGAGNREGLLSGAFWFYYRLGFRPVERDVARLARAEFARLSRGGDRPSLSTMRALTGSDLALDVEPSSAEERCEPGDLSLAVSRSIADRYEGDRRRALRDATRFVRSALGATGFARWPRGERDAFASLSLVVSLVPDLADWSAGDKAACVDVMRAKGRADDAPYFRALAAHPRLASALTAIAMGAS